ncbi:EscU/YscU/HrcU family type III secretion system export apparatus switch protein [Isosphaeraceae bacterium EP7]
MSEDAEDRTLAPSKRRLLMAREHGQVPHSPELTAAAGLLAGVALLGIWGDALANGLVALISLPLSGSIGPEIDPSSLVDSLREPLLSSMLPLLGIVGGAWLAAILAHQTQVMGLFAPQLLVPDIARLSGHGESLVSRGSRGLWGLARATLIVLAAAWLICWRLPAWQSLADLGIGGVAIASARAARELVGALALATTALGLVDLAMRHRQFTTRLMSTPEESRQEAKASDGDPALRTRRRKQAEAWRKEPTDALVGARLILTGPAGLTLVLSGGPPPKPILVRAVVRGPGGLRLRTQAEIERIPLLHNPAAARRFARRGGATPEALALLAAAWPRKPAESVVANGAEIAAN